MTSVELIADKLMQAVALKNHARIAFPGGNSASNLMKDLFKCDLPWNRISITLIDERDVPITDKISNERFVRSLAFGSKASIADFESLRIGETATLSVDQLNQSLKKKLDVVVLGIGKDGHFASLFPANEAVPGLNDSKLGFIATPPCGDPKVSRISMTLCEILSADIVLLIVGSIEKQKKLSEALSSPNDPKNPVSYIVASDHSVYVQWVTGKLSKLINSFEKLN